MKVSVIIPAYNAEATIDETLDSVIAQSYSNWEAVIVDDGSHDSTVQIVEKRMDEEPRIRLIRQEHAGVSAARNRGIAETDGEFLLFLDADDLILEHHLERLFEFAREMEPALVLSGWRRIVDEGKQFAAQKMEMEGNAMQTIMRQCPAIHSFLVRRDVVEKSGTFDETLSICEDMDFWLRIARLGIPIIAVEDVSALYRFRHDSASTSAQQLLSDGLEVIRRAHEADPRVLRPAPEFESGLPAHKFVAESYYFFTWSVGQALASNDDLLPLWNKGPSRACADLDPSDVAGCLFQPIALTAELLGVSPTEFWQERMKAVDGFLEKLEENSQMRGLARGSGVELERLIITHDATRQAYEIGKSALRHVDIGIPIDDIRIDGDVERLYCRVWQKDELIGTVEAPIIDGLVSGYVLQDLIADRLGWQILARFLERNVHASLTYLESDSSRSILRNGVELAANIPVSEPLTPALIHDRAGWTLFLQELWNEPNRSLDWFYNPAAGAGDQKHAFFEGEWVEVEVSAELCGVVSPHPQIQLLVSVGGVSIGVIPVSPVAGKISAHQVRSEIIHGTGFELCRAAVREGLLGRPVAEGGSLFQRLAAAAASRSKLDGYPSLMDDATLLATKSCAALADGTVAGSRNMLLGRSQGMVDSSASRRAEFCEANADLLVEAKLRDGEPLFQFVAHDVQPMRIYYAPDLCWKAQPEMHGTTRGREDTHADATWRYDRGHFEMVFAKSADPWKYTTDYERIKYEQTLSLLPPGPIERALEIGCAEGHFTVELAKRVKQLVTADISEIALARTAERTAHFENIKMQQLDLKTDPLPGVFDLIVCSELLYFMDDLATLRAVCRKLAEALKPGGRLLVAHAHFVIDEPDKTGYDWGLPFGAKTFSDVLKKTGLLALEEEVHTPLYRIQLFKRRKPLDFILRRSKSKLHKLVEPPALPYDDVAATIRWNGGEPGAHIGASGVTVTTEALPILMYHQISGEGEHGGTRYCLHPDQFRAQLGYLRDTGYRSVTLAEWQAAMQRHEPLRGRAVMLTFDDGYRNFLTDAWPLLKEYGYSATVFLVSEHSGGVSEWDAAYSDPAPLLDWGEIRQLHNEGVQFGSHTASHLRLTTLSPAEIVNETLKARLRIELELGEAIRSIAYPFGDEDMVVHHLAGAAGYRFGFTCEGRKSSLWDRPLALPRIEVCGDETFADFVLKLEAGAA